MGSHEATIAERIAAQTVISIVLFFVTLTTQRVDVRKAALILGGILWLSIHRLSKGIVRAKRDGQETWNQGPNSGL
jgi:hypothetical protein